VRHDLVIDFIFTVPPNFFICDGSNVSFIENCKDPASRRVARNIDRGGKQQSSLNI